MPQLGSFRKVTRTEGVDPYALNYMDYCVGENSATQQTADVIEAVGIDPRDENPFLPNAALLRSAEAVDSILNAASSGRSDVSNSQNTGRILCAIVQLGGLIYFFVLGLIALILLNMLPLVNFVFQLLFDGCVAVVSNASAGRIKKTNVSDSLGNTKFTRALATGRTKQTGALFQEPFIDDEFLSPQQMRAITRKRRGDLGATSYSARLFDASKRIFGSVNEQTGLMEQPNP